MWYLSYKSMRQAVDRYGKHRDSCVCNKHKVDTINTRP